MPTWKRLRERESAVRAAETELEDENLPSVPDCDTCGGFFVADDGVTICFECRSPEDGGRDPDAETVVLYES